MILAGDIGGTKVLLSIFDMKDGHLTALKSKKYASAGFENLDSIVLDFLKDVEAIPQRGVFGIPGPVGKGKNKLTNLPWVIDASTLSENTGIGKVKIVNDLAATAYNIPFLESHEVIQIKKGTTQRVSENFVVVAPGTGLGEAFLFCEEGKKIVIPSEGGHTDFAPTNEIEAELYKYLAKRYKHVSYERVISGKGIPNIFDFLIASHYAKPESNTLERMKTEDKAVVISDTAMHLKDEVSMKAMEIFISVLAAHAGNLVITAQATGGVYLGGGIPYKILPLFKQERFIDNFTAKGRLKTLTDSTPVFVITNNTAALHGAARLAFELN